MGRRKLKRNWKKIKMERKRKSHRKERTTRKWSLEVAQAKQFVTNLSELKLTETQLCLLAKGQKFVPLNNIVKKELLHDIDMLGRKMRIKYQFRHEHDTIHPFWVKSPDYEPPLASNAIEDFILAMKIECSDLDTSGLHLSNLSLEQRRAITELNQNPEIIIRPADKGSNTVVLSRKQYFDECQRQLDAGIHYEEIEKANCTQTHKEVLNIIREMHSKDILDDQTFKFLHNPEATIKTPKFYLLPKIHKIKEKIMNMDPLDPKMDQNTRVPGRPIIAQWVAPQKEWVGTWTFFLSHW